MAFCVRLVSFSVFLRFVDIAPCVSTCFSSSFFSLLCEQGLWDLGLPQGWSLRPLRRKRGVLTAQRPADSLSSVAFLWLIILLCTMYINFCLYTHQLMDGSWFFFFSSIIFYLNLCPFPPDQILLSFVCIINYSAYCFVLCEC